MGLGRLAIPHDMLRYFRVAVYLVQLPSHGLIGEHNCSLPFTVLIIIIDA